MIKQRFTAQKRNRVLSCFKNGLSATQAAGKTLVFGLLKRNEKVYVKVVETCSRESLMPIIQGLTLESSTICTNGWKAYEKLEIKIVALF